MSTPARRIQLISFFRKFGDRPHEQAAVKLLEDQMPERLLQSDAEWVEAFDAAVPTKPETIWVNEAVKFIAEEEAPNGEPILDAYLDPVGIPTIGLGTIRYPDGREVRMGDRITRELAFDFIRNDLTKRFIPCLEQSIYGWTRMNGAQRVALLSWAYNVGVGAVKDSTLARRLKAGEDPGAVVRTELPRWNKGIIGGKKQVLPGLTARRKREVRKFLSQDGPQEPTVKPSQGVGVPDGMAGPAVSPHAFGFRPGDYHLVVDDKAEVMAAFNYDGQRLWSIPALARGQSGETEWTITGSDTPPGLYRVGQIYRDYDSTPVPGQVPSSTRDRLAYGWYSLDLVDLEGQESRHGRAGIMIHGGGSALGWPGAWAERQPLIPTLGCVRLHNIDLRDKVVPLADSGVVYVSVLQERRI